MTDLDPMIRDRYLALVFWRTSRLEIHVRLFLPTLRSADVNLSVSGSRANLA